MALVLLAAACAKEPVCLPPTAAGEVAAPPAPACDNAQLERYAGLPVLAPHPDDEVLAGGTLNDLRETARRVAEEFKKALEGQALGVKVVPAM